MAMIITQPRIGPPKCNSSGWEVCFVYKSNNSWIYVMLHLVSLAIQKIFNNKFHCFYSPFSYTNKSSFLKHSFSLVRLVFIVISKMFAIGAIFQLAFFRVICIMKFYSILNFNGH